MPTGSFSPSFNDSDPIWPNEHELRQEFSDAISKLSLNDDQITEVDLEFTSLILTAFQAISAFHPPAYSSSDKKESYYSQISTTRRSQNENEEFDRIPDDVMEWNSSQQVPQQPGNIGLEQDPSSQLKDDEMAGILRDMMDDSDPSILLCPDDDIGDITPRKPQKSLHCLSQKSSRRELFSNNEEVSPTQLGSDSPSITKIFPDLTPSKNLKSIKGRKRVISQVDGADDSDEPVILITKLKRKSREKSNTKDMTLRLETSKWRKHRVYRMKDQAVHDSFIQGNGNNHEGNKSFNFGVGNSWSPVTERPLESYPFFISPPIPNSPTQKSLNEDADLPLMLNNNQIHISSLNSIGKVSNQSIVRSYSGIHSAPASCISPPANPHKPSREISFKYPINPPYLNQLDSTMNQLNLKKYVHTEPFFSNIADVPRISEFGGKQFNFKTVLSGFNPELALDKSISFYKGIEYFKERHSSPDDIRKQVWKLANTPPTGDEVRKWAQANPISENILPHTSQIDGPTQPNTQGFKFASEGFSDLDGDKLSILSLEIHVRTRGDLLPDPSFDQICAVFYCLQAEDDAILNNGTSSGYHVGMIIVDEIDRNMKRSGINGVPTIIVEQEIDLFHELADIVKNFDPDILVG